MAEKAIRLDVKTIPAKIMDSVKSSASDFRRLVDPAVVRQFETRKTESTSAKSDHK